MLQLDGSGFNHQISRGVQGWDHAKITHLMARDGHSEEPSALTHELMSWNMPIINPTGIGSPGDVSNVLGIFAGGTRGTSTTAGCTETVPPTNRSLGDKRRLHLVTLMHELIQDVITVHQAQNLKRHSPKNVSNNRRCEAELEPWGLAKVGAMWEGDWYVMGVWKWIQFGVPDSHPLWY